MHKNEWNKELEIENKLRWKEKAWKTLNYKTMKYESKIQQDRKMKRQEKWNW